MTAQSPKEKMKDCHGPFAAAFGRSHSTLPASVTCAIFGCLLAGAVGIIRASTMDTPLGVLTCLLGSVAAFGLVMYVRLRKP